MVQAEGYRVHEQNVGLETYRLHRLNQLLVFASQMNGFYREKLRGVRLPLRSTEELGSLPFTMKRELMEDQEKFPPFGRNHTYPLSSYVRYHQTSGTTGKPLKVLDTKKSWEWWEDCWLEVLRTAGVTEEDRVFLAFSFGPFIGFWSAYEAAKKSGALVIPGGGQTSVERLTAMEANGATTLLCTPSYALHLAEVAREQGLDLTSSSVRKIITAGEPGGSIPSVRRQIEEAWGGDLYDHAGMTEMGAYGYSCSMRNGLHVNESQFIAEVIDPKTHRPVEEGETGELVLTNLGRYGYPLIRYRTGDVVRNSGMPCNCGNPQRFLPEGILGRSDDMVIVRGINIFPQSIEAVIREFPEVAEFRIIYYTVQEMNQVKVQVEAPDSIVPRLAERLRSRIGLRIDVEPVTEGFLPRFEMKSRRVVDQRMSQASPLGGSSS
ncbi:phenylacetate-CoA ligase [Melghirimyces profundicolus]|uniref:Phenylacetate-CoA ligase n=1 Tax=Melghirimyces profundicolus TaxID=1242148 RepID=A0A2T6C8J2_9BACL|nr:AMP-binding protein [Melghirimyces profundicolus]PTX64630.1 phenylacetate-CoA ligase [Melghirimyces profundicolus]